MPVGQGQLILCRPGGAKRWMVDAEQLAEGRGGGLLSRADPPSLRFAQHPCLTRQGTLPGGTQRGFLPVGGVSFLARHRSLPAIRANSNNKLVSWALGLNLSVHVCLLGSCLGVRTQLG